MKIIKYKETKKINPQKVYDLFKSVGWIDIVRQNNRDAIANHTLIVSNKNFEDLFKASIENSTYVVSAWEKNNLIGIVRVLSDTVSRSIAYDLIVRPDFQNKGIGKKLAGMCMKKFPKTQWTIGTSSKNFGYYEKLGFKRSTQYMEKESKYY